MSQGTLAGINTPPDWGWERLWSAAPRVQVVGEPDAEPLSVFLQAGVVPRSSREDNHNQLGEDLSKYLVVHPGDLVFNKLRTWQGGLGVSTYHGIVSPAYFVCRPVGEWHARYLHFLLISSPYLAELTRLSKFMPPSQFDIPWDMLRTLPLLRPPLDEQRRIADFLGGETARIDHLAGLQQSVLEKIHQRDRAVRDNLVDEIAEKTGELPLRRFSPRIEQGSSPSCENHPREPGEWGVLKLSAVKQGRFFPGENKQLPGDIEPLVEYEVHERDLLVTRANTPELVGDVAVVSGADRRLLLPDLIYRVSLDRRIAVDFISHVFLSTRVRSLIQATARGSSQSMVKLRGEDIREWPVPRADAAQQARVVAEIEDQLQSSDKLRTVINRQLALLAERRQAVITAAVTGGITV